MCVWFSEMLLNHLVVFPTLYATAMDLVRCEDLLRAGIP